MVDRWIQTDHAARFPIHGMLTAVGDLPATGFGGRGRDLRRSRRQVPRRADRSRYVGAVADVLRGGVKDLDVLG